ncbi:shikimate dehydrogenase [Sneathiella aquimaris]|uniref:shikimate dehydrogenase n=1 Tax=Sneathiella aquimaris TaxID=2599305 RepID=UPI00146ACB88|nr:shikimate dehydrogenase [Sneathiella aquimaris]
MKKNAGVMGFPIAHSLSPRLHGYWIKKYGLDADYLAREVRPENLKDTLRRLPQECLSEGSVFCGTNLTIPLKEAAMDIVDIVEEAAQKIGAVNTVVVNEEGQLIGRNTDGLGFQDSLAEHVDIKTFHNKTALVLGAGGAARAIVFACLMMGFRRILLTNRTRQRAIDLAQDMKSEKIDVIQWEERAAFCKEADLLVNTTSLGMTGQDPLELNLDRLKNGCVVTDIVYVPLETDLLRQAREKGYRTVDGLGMLLHQAKAGFEAWFGIKPEVDAALRDYVLQGLNKK